MSLRIGSIRRPPKRLVDSFHRFNTSTICNALDQKGLSGAIFDIKAVAPRMQALGCVVTVLETCGERGSAKPEEMNLAAIIEAVEPGDIVVIANNGHRVSSGGGVFSYALKAAGAGGLVVDGGVRDVEQIQQYQLPTFAKHIVPLTGKSRLKVEAINEPVLMNGVVVRPGDIVLGDANGIVCIPQDSADALRELAEKQDARDDQTIEYMRQGLSFREAQARAGVK